MSPTKVSLLSLIMPIAGQKPYLKIQLTHFPSKKITKILNIKYVLCVRDEYVLGKECFPVFEKFFEWCYTRLDKH